MGNYADSGPLCQGARSFHDLESITIAFSTKKGVRKPVSKIDTLKNVLSWTLLLLMAVYPALFSWTSFQEIMGTFDIYHHFYTIVLFLPHSDQFYHIPYYQCYYYE